MLDFKKKIKVGIINLGLNNLFSIYNACKFVGYKTKIIDKKNNFKNFDIIILPGIGSFDVAMKKIQKENIDEKIKQFSFQKNKLIFGICLGMQLLFSKSNEFVNCKGLNLINGEVKKLKKSSKFSIPHMGWNDVLNFNKPYKKFYFVHSYGCFIKEEVNSHYYTKYGQNKFISVVQKNNILGVQFHPEKSGKSGISFLKNLDRFII